MQTTNITGLEGLPIKLKGINVVIGNLNQKLPFPDNSFDVIISHFSLEHLYNSGLFISETYRVLKKGGYTVVATDNLSAWPNIIALIFGWQPFSTAGGVGKRPLGNPLALRAGTMGEDLKISERLEEIGEFSHNKVMSYQMLLDSYKEYKFTIEKIIGVGYFPFSGFLSKLFCKLDARHSHLLILKARKS